MIGWPHPFFDWIAITKWLNQTFGYHLTAPQLLNDPNWEDWHLDMHFAYADVFNDKAFLEKVKKYRKKLAEKGVFSAMYELGPGQDEEG